MRVVAAGDAWLDPTVTARVLNTYRRAPSDGAVDASTDKLTSRERDVLAAVARGLSNGEIAQRFVISELTVKSHIGRIFAKLGVRDRAAAIVYAFDHGIAHPGGAAEPQAPQ